MSNNNILEKNIGSGALFPIKLTENARGETGWYPVTGNPDLIINNLNALIQYELGFRIRQEDFGTRLWECIEEPNTQAQVFLVNQFVRQAFSRWENRIDITRVEVSREGTKVHLSISYSIRNTNQSDVVGATYEQ